MPDIIPFDFDGNAVRVVRDQGGEPWFVAKDVCAILEISNHKDAVSRLEEDERRGSVVPTPLGGPQEMLTVSESGLYALIFTSRKTEAKRFRKWVTSEVLPSLRKAGKYEVPGRSREGFLAELPEEARILRPTMRAVALNAAMQMFKTRGGTDEDFELYLHRFCSWLSGRPARRGLDQGPWSAHIQRFAQECCRSAPGQRVRAGKVYDAFRRWWGRRFSDLTPTQHAFGLFMGRLYTSARRGGNVWYFDLALTGD